MARTGYEAAVGEDLVRAHLPLVKRIAARLMARLPPSVEMDDLVQVGLMALMEAAANFDAEANAQFETYASLRIKGAMLDELRAMDWLPRSARRAMREIEQAIQTTQQKLKRTPTDSDVARTMGLKIEEYQERLYEAAGHQLLHYEDLEQHDQAFLETHQVEGEPVDDPLAVLSDQRFRGALVEAIRRLPQREQLLMSLYYEQELNLKEIGLVLEVSESRVCQLHAQAVARLRTHLSGWLHGKD